MHRPDKPIHPINPMEQLVSHHKPRGPDIHYQKQHRNDIQHPLLPLCHRAHPDKHSHPVHNNGQVQRDLKLPGIFEEGGLCFGRVGGVFGEDPVEVGDHPVDDEDGDPGHVQGVDADVGQDAGQGELEVKEVAREEGGGGGGGFGCLNGGHYFHK